jgi:drug/metabolite transporter (DMT)-like permease
MARTEVDAPRRRLAGPLRTSALLLLAAAMVYVGIAVLVSIVGSSSLNATGLMGAAVYFALAVVLPVVAAALFRRKTRLSWPRTVAIGAGVCVVVNLAFLPVAVVALSM